MRQQNQRPVPGTTEEDSARTEPRLRLRLPGTMTSEDVDVEEVDLLQCPSNRHQNFYPKPRLGVKSYFHIFKLKLFVILQLYFLFNLFTELIKTVFSME